MPKNIYRGEPDFRHDEIPAVGVLIANLGTPSEPTAKGLRPYLKEFLSDPRVIELNRVMWWLILNGIILNTRPAKSAELYRSIWTEEGSPLLVTSEKVTKALEERARAEVATPIHFELGMTYGDPSIPHALAALRGKGCRRILMLPLYAHYSSSSTGAVFDAVMKELMTWRRVPEIRTIHEYHGEPALIDALAAAIREQWKEGEPEKIVMSYHGIPERYFLDGDPYHCFCHKTSRLIAEKLGLDKEKYIVTFQSQFGREKWIGPKTDETLAALAESGVKKVDVICPGFAIDCLETLEEIDGENREIFMHAGGEEFRYIKCLNDRPEHLDALHALVMNNLGGWVSKDWDADTARREAEACDARAKALRAA